MKDVVLVIDVISALGLVGLILLQQGKGADIGASFGSGASQTLFGSRGTANFLTRTTAVLAAVFFVCNLGLVWLINHGPTASVTQSVIIEQPVQPAAPIVSEPTDKPVSPTVPEVPR